MPKTAGIREMLGLGLLLAVLVAGSLGFLGIRVSGQSSVVSRSVTVSSDPNPNISTVTLNNGSAITLTANATSVVRVNFTVTDGTGCGHIFFNGNVTTSVFRSGAATSSCVANALFCYVVSTSTHNCPFSTSSQETANATATIELYYFAEATDASSSFPSENWMASVIARDASSTTDTATSTGVELNSLLALDLVTSTLAYGSLFPGGNTGATNKTMPVKNAGNTSSSLRVSGTALTFGSRAIATSSQHYATSTFTFGGFEQILNSAAQTVSGFLIPRPPLAIWVNTTPMQGPLDFHASAIYANHLYVTGGVGAGGTVTSTVRYAPLNASGSVGTWALTTALANPVRYHETVAHIGYLYVIGGQNTVNTGTSTVLYAPINATGSVGAWTATTALPNPRKMHAAQVQNNFLYVIGGRDGGNPGTPQNTVYYAPINTTGSLGTWATTTQMLLALDSHGAVFYNGFLYVTGGVDSGSSYRSDVSYAAINATGSLGSWFSTVSLPYIIASHAMVEDNGILYVIGGQFALGSNFTSTVSFAPWKADGTLGSWASTIAFPNTLYGHDAERSNGYVYVSGADSTATSTVQFSSLASRNTYWGAEVPAGTATGTYTGTVSFVGVFEP